MWRFSLLAFVLACLLTPGAEPSQFVLKRLDRIRRWLQREPRTFDELHAHWSDVKPCSDVFVQPYDLP